MLATGVNGSQAAQTFKVTYSDGTTSTFAQTLSDWFKPQNFAGESVAVAMPRRNSSRGLPDMKIEVLNRDNQRMQVWIENKWDAFADPVQVRNFRHHHKPADACHDPQQADDHPARPGLRRHTHDRPATRSRSRHARRPPRRHDRRRHGPRRTPIRLPPHLRRPPTQRRITRHFTTC